jgi:hypothetical protein
LRCQSYAGYITTTYEFEARICFHGDSTLMTGEALAGVEDAWPPRNRRAHLATQQYFVGRATAWYVRLSIARIRATGITALCRPNWKIIAEAALQDRRIDILDAAARPFVDQGFAATSLDRVSHEIGSAGDAIYCYYRSKLDLFLAVHRPAMELAQRAIRPPRKSEGKVLERLRGTASAHTVLVMAQLPYLRVGDQEHPDASARAHQ